MVGEDGSDEGLSHSLWEWKRDKGHRERLLRFFIDNLESELNSSAEKIGRFQIFLVLDVPRLLTAILVFGGAGLKT